MGFGREVVSYIGSKIVGRHDEFLHERGIEPDHLKRLSIQYRHAWDVWFRETLTGRRDPTEILHAWTSKSGESLGEHVLEGVEFVGRMDIADRASNGFRLALRTDIHTGKQSAFGEAMWKAYNNPRLSDHNHEHNRRLERWLESMLLNIGQLRHSDSVLKWIDSTFVYGYFHDIDQLLTAQRNIDENRVGVDGLKPKKGHSLAAAIMLLATHRRYGEERVIRNREAWETAAGAAYMCLKHDEPELLSDALVGKEKAFRLDSGERRLLHGDDLYNKFIHNSLDLTTISPSQLIELLKRIKGENGFISDATPFGLHPDFEREYAFELQDLAKNKTPLFREISEDRKKSLKLATEVAVRADMIEMIAPPVESIFRTLMTDISKKRPFWRDNISLEAIRFGQGNQDVNDSDVRRLLWEIVHIDSFGEHSMLGKTKYLQRINRDNAIMGLLAFKKIGSEIMAGNMTIIDSVYKHRMWELGRKVLLKTGLNPIKVSVFMSRHPEKKTSIEAFYADIESLSGGHHDALMSQYLEKTKTLAQEADHLRSVLQGKHINYTSEQVVHFDQICDSVLGILQDLHSVSKKQMRRYKARAAKGEYFPDSTPYKTYDSIGSPGLRVLIQTRDRNLEHDSAPKPTPTRFLHDDDDDEIIY